MKNEKGGVARRNKKQKQKQNRSCERRRQSDRGAMIIGFFLYQNRKEKER